MVCEILVPYPGIQLPAGQAQSLNQETIRELPTISILSIKIVTLYEVLKYEVCMY